MKKNMLNIDTAKGFEVIHGGRNKTVKHFDTYEEAWAYAKTKRGSVVRYWEAK